MDQRQNRPARTARFLGLFAVGAIMLACGRGVGDGATTRATTVTSVPVTAAVTTLASDPVAGYRAYWAAYLASADPMDPQSPALAEHATGAALEAVRRSFLALRASGKVIRGQLDLAPTVLGIEGDTATVRDCYGDGTGLYDGATGVRQDSPSGKRHLVTATMRLEAGVWKLERLRDEGLGCTSS